MTSDAALAHDTTLMPYAAAHAGRYDEAVTPDGTVRPAWRDLLTAIAALSPAERMRRAEQIDASVRQTGIAFDPFADPLANESCWHLNLMPLLLSDADWSALSAATLQRARLSDRLVGDVYGSQTLLESGALPPELIFADAAYLRPAEGTVAASGGVTFFAADFARWPDGAWRIIDTHTETVAGISYAIANRVTLTHVLGDIFKACNAVRIATHFSAVQAALRETAGGDTPRMALLTPGPHHPDYFAHAYLARYLGLFLVEGFDLRTAGDRVALKTLEGLQDIDLIVRCVEGIASDPLHLDGARLEAPPGLIDVVRTKQRLCANAIGSAIAQNRGIGPHLDGICERLLGEPLGVPDAPRLWLGDAAHRTRVLGDLDRYVIRTAQETTGRPGQAERGRMAGALTAEERDRLVLDIEMSGARFVAEEPATFATAPAFSNGVLEPMPFALRLFAVRSGDTFRVMPGGLAMGVAAGEAVALTAPQGHARDVWVTADRPQNDTASLWKPAIATARVDRSNKALQSRVADTLFWIGRLSERADWTLRMTRSALRRTQEDGNVETGRRAARRCLAALLVDTPAAEQPARADNGAPVSDPAIPEIETLVTTLIRDPQAARGLHLTCAGLYRNATQARDRLSLEAWHVLSGFRVAGPWMRGLARGSSSQALDSISQGLDALAAFNGLMHENMTRNHGWALLDTGRRIERAYNLAEAMHAAFRAHADPEDEYGALLLILESADSYITYRSRYRLDPMLALVLDLLVLDETNPRSLGFQLAATTEHLAILPDAMEGSSLTGARRQALALQTAVQLCDVDALAKGADHAELNALLRQMKVGLPQLSDAIARQYFNLTAERMHASTMQL